MLPYIYITYQQWIWFYTEVRKVGYVGSFEVGDRTTVSQGEKFQTLLTRIPELGLIKDVGFPVHTLVRLACLPQHPVIDRCCCAVGALQWIRGAEQPCGSCRGLPLNSQYVALTGIGASTLGTIGQFVQEIQQVYPSFQRTMSIPLNLHNKDYVTVKLLDKLTEVRWKWMWGKLLSLEFATLPGTPAHSHVY